MLEPPPTVFEDNKVGHAVLAASAVSKRNELKLWGLPGRNNETVPLLVLPPRAPPTAEAAAPLAEESSAFSELPFVELLLLEQAAIRDEAKMRRVSLNFKSHLRRCLPLISVPVRHF